MKEACEKNGVLLMEAFAYRQSPLTYKVKELVEKGTIGKLKFIEAHFNYPLYDTKNVRLSKALTGGSIYDVGCYNLNIIRYIAGVEPASIYAAGEIGKESGVDESACIMLEFGDGLSAISYCSFKSIDRSEYTIVGEAGIIEVPVRYNSKGNTKIIVRTEKGAEEINIECPDNYMTLESLRNQLSLVLQDVFLFNGTIAENIAYGCGDASQEEIVNAAKIA